MKTSSDVRLIIALCTTWLIIPAMSSCPQQCLCKWRNGKRYVECANKYLNEIPEAIDAETQVLNFPGNNLKLLPREAFQSLGLFNLQKIFLSKCNVHKIDDLAFKGLANLVELDLSNNFITVIPTANFHYIQALMRLSLNNNPITVLKSQAFESVSQLTALELSKCKIHTIEEDAFSGLRRLEHLLLDGNKLTTVKGKHLFPESLREIALKDNRWNCDCQMVDLRDWLLNFNLPATVEPFCNAPERLANRKITTVSVAEMACVPLITPTSVYLETNEGNNVTLECLIEATPEAEITWKFGKNIIKNTTEVVGAKTALKIMGTNEKRTELTIFNVGPEDNGTYSCFAENIAGVVHGNYTLKVIIKEVPVVVVVSFPRKHLVFIVTGVFLVIVLIIAIAAVVLLKLNTSGSKNRKNNQTNITTIGTRSMSSRPMDTSAEYGRKNNGNIILHSQTHYSCQNTVDSYIDIKNGTVDQNPDLVNDAEMLADSSSNSMSMYCGQNVATAFENGSTYPLPPMQRQVTWVDQQRMMNVTGAIPNHNIYNMHHHAADVHLNPECFMDSDGYPYDYGLPKVTCRPMATHTHSLPAAGYQTLPHNRPKPQKVACKFANDTEFNTPNCYNIVANNFRHLQVGYPVLPQNRQVHFTSGNEEVYTGCIELVPSPPEGYKNNMVTCCSVQNSEPCSSWSSPKGACAVMVPMDIGDSKTYHVETRCVDTQTLDVKEPNERVPPAGKSSNKCDLEVCTESPDEGYVGECIDGNM